MSDDRHSLHRAPKFEREKLPSDSLGLSGEQRNLAHDDGALTLCNTAVQRLLDYGVLHFTDEGFYVGKWPETNTPSRALTKTTKPGEATDQ